MIADRYEIAAVRKDGAGELHITIGQRPVIGGVYALQPAVGRPARCHAKVLDVWEHISGGWVTVVQLVATEIPPRFISAKGTHYTTDPGQAARDPETGTPEWAPPADWVDPGAAVREEYRKTLESDTIAALLPEVETWDDLVRIRQLARSRHVDISADLRVVEERIEARERKRRRGADDSADTQAIQARVESIGRKLGKAA